MSKKHTVKRPTKRITQRINDTYSIEVGHDKRNQAIALRLFQAGEELASVAVPVDEAQEIGEAWMHEVRNARGLLC